MEPDTSIRVGLLSGAVSALSWFLFAEEDLASPVNSLVAGILGFTVPYAIVSLIEHALESHKDRPR
jgi:hypothetical protein